MLGSGNYKITTMAELDFDKELVDKEQYTTPTVSGEQMKEGLLEVNKRIVKLIGEEIHQRQVLQEQVVIYLDM